MQQRRINNKIQSISNVDHPKRIENNNKSSKKNAWTIFTKSIRLIHCLQQRGLLFVCLNKTIMKNIDDGENTVSLKHQRRRKKKSVRCIMLAERYIISLR